MKQCNKSLILLIFSLIPFINVFGQHSLFSNGKSSYTIVIDAKASASEQTAANELQNYIYQISKIKLPISNNLNNNGNNIYIGWNDKVASLSKKSQPSPDDEGFTYQNIGNDLLIYGGSQRGTMYGVFSFLEQQLGVHWYTPEFTKITPQNTYTFTDMNHSESSKLKYRYIMYYDLIKHDDFCAHNLLNTSNQPTTNEYGNMKAFWGAHTLNTIIPVSLFKSHPEYFSLYKGKRILDGQRCLSNPKVIDLCIDSLKNIIRKRPGYQIYSLGQIDSNIKACQCDNCKKLVEKYGNQSGAIIWFVNKIAEAIKKDYPDVYIGTFAYIYSRKAPTNIRPRNNVFVRICTNDCCFAHPIGQCSKNQSFLKDLKDWSNLTSNLYVWDYAVDFKQYLAPYPNFNVFSSNIKTYINNNVIGVQEQAAYNTKVSQFSELRAWILAKLLWNPNQDINKLAQQFISDYYEEASPYIQEYYNLCQSLIQNDIHLDKYFIDINNKFYTSDFIAKSTSLLNKAKKAAANSKELTKRVDLVRLQILYLKFARNKKQSQKDGSYSEFIELIKKYKPNIKETITTDKFLTSEGIK